jgi:hypothetical protein
VHVPAKMVGLTSYRRGRGCDAITRELTTGSSVPLSITPQDNNNEAVHCSTRHRGTRIPCLVAQIFNTCWNTHCNRSCSYPRHTPMECVLRTVSCVLFGWQCCDQSTYLYNHEDDRLTSSQVKHDIKAKLTQSANGASGGEGSRNHVQVIANSGVASILILLHLWHLKKSGRYDYSKDLCWEHESDALVVGIVAYVSHYIWAWPRTNKL